MEASVVEEREKPAKVVKVNLNLNTENLHCFFCLKSKSFLQIKNEIQTENVTKNEKASGSQRTDTNENHAHLLKNLCEFLEINFDKILSSNNEDDLRETSIPPKTGKVVEQQHSKEDNKNGRALQKVSFCGNCDTLMEKLSALLHNLEKIQKEVSLCFQNIHQEISNAENNNDLAKINKVYHQKFMSRNIDKLRKDISKKCLITKFKSPIGSQNKPHRRHVSSTSPSCESPSPTTVPAKKFGIDSSNESSSPASFTVNVKTETAEPFEETPQPPLLPSPSEIKFFASTFASPSIKTKAASTPQKDNYLDCKGLAISSSPVEKLMHETSKCTLKNSGENLVKFENEGNKQVKVKTEQEVAIDYDYDAAVVTSQRTQSEQTPRSRPKYSNTSSTDKSLFIDKNSSGMYRCRYSSCQQKFDRLGIAWQHCQRIHLNSPQSQQNSQPQTVKVKLKLSQKFSKDSESGKDDHSQKKQRGECEYGHCHQVYDSATNKYKYKCSYPLCDKPAFASVKSASNHYDAVHLNVKYNCAICNGEFRYLSYMKKHMKTCIGVS